jgi:hypothetical protein
MAAAGRRRHGRAGEEAVEIRTQTAAPGSWGAAAAESWASCRQVRGLVCAGHHKPHGGLLRLAAASPAAGCSDSEPAAPSKINQIDREIQKSEMNSLPECRRLPESPWMVAHRCPCGRQLAGVRASRRPLAEGSLSGEHTSMPPPLADGSPEQ